MRAWEEMRLNTLCVSGKYVLFRVLSNTDGGGGKAEAQAKSTSHAQCT